MLTWLIRKLLTNGFVVVCQLHCDRKTATEADGSEKKVSAKAAS